MKSKFLVAATSLSFLAASMAFAAPQFTKVDDSNSSTMQQMPSDASQMPTDNNAASVAPGPMADAGNTGSATNSTADVGNAASSTPGPMADAGSAAAGPNVGAIPPSNTMPSDNSASQDPNSQMSANNMDPQNVSASSDTDMNADTTTGDDDY